MAGKSAKISSKSKSHPEAGKGAASFFYDSEAGTVLGRTFTSWVKIIIFYIIYYICLAAFAGLNYYLFSRTLIENEPKWKLSESLIGTNPGIGFRPLPDQDKNSESTLIWYNAKNDRDAKFWYSQLTEFIEKVDLPAGSPGVVDCSFGTEPSGSDACRVQVDQSKLGPCTIDNKFGYTDSKPCVLVKLNKIYGWEPEPFGLDENGKYDSTALQRDLDEYVKDYEMPESVPSAIKKAIADNPGNEKAVLKSVWISCQGENVGDVESLPDNRIEYHPMQGIPGYYFPYVNQKNYRSPFVLVRLDIPAESHHVIINVECRAWAKNIKYDKIARLGSVHLEVMVD